MIKARNCDFCNDVGFLPIAACNQIMLS
jgi:hypothetical protein